ncbi:hypothetical protein JCM19046_1896 [Bacillus sp. JCM 19046]|nr:hypothetical protein JCM19046_1896 [Bacillus sp. JCM 19046]
MEGTGKEIRIVREERESNKAITAFGYSRKITSTVIRTKGERKKFSFGKRLYGARIVSVHRHPVKVNY